MTKEEQIREEASKAWAELDSLIIRLRVEENSAHSELEELNRKLSRTLLEWAKGNASRDEVKAVKQRMAEVRELIDDMPTILRELEKEKRQRCFRPLQDAGHLSKEREKYNGLKEKIFESYEQSLVDDLRRYARTIGEEEDCEKFLACIGMEASKEQ